MQPEVFSLKERPCLWGKRVALLGYELPSWDTSCPLGIRVALLGYELPMAGGAFLVVSCY